MNTKTITHATRGSRPRLQGEERGLAVPLLEAAQALPRRGEVTSRQARPGQVDPSKPLNGRARGEKNAAAEDFLADAPVPAALAELLAERNRQRLGEYAERRCTTGWSNRSGK